MHDALVVGLGAMGSAALHHLAARGCRVMGVDRYDPPHSLGSTHGRTRIIREAYYEHPSYVPLVRRAYENWSALERETGTALFQRTGGLMMGRPTCGLLVGTKESARRHGIDVETLDAPEIVRRFPAFVPEPDMVGVLEQNAGILFPELCVAKYLETAVARGAELRRNARVTALSRTNGGWSAETDRGPVTARRVIVSAGPWASDLLAMLGTSIPLDVERQTMHWWAPRDATQLLTADRYPVTMIEHEPDRIVYAVPDLGDGVKSAIHHEGAIVSPDAVRRSVGEDDTAPARALLERFAPSAAGALRESLVCLYTDTPDHDFIIDALEGMPDVILLSACSGHGFKFASAIGEVAAQMTLGESVGVDMSRFRANRFA